jgi:hypothetical protein
MTRSFFDPFAWLTALTAILALWIAYQQYQMNRAKLRLDLYERRFRVFDAVGVLLATIYRDADVKQEDLFRFAASTNEAIFLFGPEIPSYLDELRKNAVRLRTLNDKLHESRLPVGPERSQAVDENAEVLKWLIDQFHESRKRFARYLDFRRSF